MAAAASAGEYVVFASGIGQHVDRHETEGTKIRLYAGSAVIEVDAWKVRRCEPDEFFAPAPAAKPPAPPEAESSPDSSPAALADAAADKYGLPRQLVRSVMSAESAFRPTAVSPKGAVGLMQLMPATAQSLGVDLYDPAQNVDAGARYLRDLLIRYDRKLWHALAAYNAGPEAVDRYGGVPPYPETISYVRRIDREYKKASQ